MKGPTPEELLCPSPAELLFLKATAPPEDLGTCPFCLETVTFLENSCPTCGRGKPFLFPHEIPGYAESMAHRKLKENS